MKSCVACAEEIQDSAKLCKHCGTRQDDPHFVDSNVFQPTAGNFSPSASTKRLSKKPLIISFALIAALATVAGTYAVVSSVQQQREGEIVPDMVQESEVSEVTEEESSAASIEPEEKPPPPEDWFCLEPGIFGIRATCETRVDNDENGLYWYLNLVCFDDGTTTQWVDASTNGATRGSSAVDWLPLADASAVKIRIDDDADEWPISIENDETSFTFRTASTASQSAWDFLAAIAPAQTLVIEVADAGGKDHRVEFPVSGSTTVAALFSVNGCSSSGPR